MQPISYFLPVSICEQRLNIFEDRFLGRITNIILIISTNTLNFSRVQRAVEVISLPWSRGAWCSSCMTSAISKRQKEALLLHENGALSPQVDLFLTSLAKLTSPASVEEKRSNLFFSCTLKNYMTNGRDVKDYRVNISHSHLTDAALEAIRGSREWLRCWGRVYTALFCLYVLLGANSKTMLRMIGLTAYRRTFQRILIDTAKRNVRLSLGSDSPLSHLFLVLLSVTQH